MRRLYAALKENRKQAAFPDRESSLPVWNTVFQKLRPEPEWLLPEEPEYPPE